MKTSFHHRSVFTATCLAVLLALPAQVQAAPLDLTAAGAIAALKADAASTPPYGESYNLGPTGLRGWIDLDGGTGADGTFTATSRQILVTVASTPASAVLAVDDVILGAMAGSSGTVPAFTSDCRKAFGVAIGDAEKAGAGTLRVKRWRAGTITDVNIAMTIMGNYTATAPYSCPKSSQILANARTKLVGQLLADANFLNVGQNYSRPINGLALLAGVAPSDPDYAAVQTRLQTYARATATAGPQPSGLHVWEWAYSGLFLAEYYLSTGDANVVAGINNFTLALVQAQSIYGTFGHSPSVLRPDGSGRRMTIGYGPVNQVGIVANMAIFMGKKALVAAGQAISPEIDPAIQRGSNFFAWYVNKGPIPYGEHEPYMENHSSNGKDPLCAVFFGLQADRTAETEYYTRMTTAAFNAREDGHTGQGFSYLWGALGANMGGPLAVAEYLKKVRWHLDLERRTDGSFVYDGQEGHGPGTTVGGTYLGKSSYYDMNPTAIYVLTYSLPLQRLYITGKNAIPANTLDASKVANAIAAATFKQDSPGDTIAQLTASLSDFDPVVRHYAAVELAKRTLTTAETNTLIAMISDPNANARQGACQTLGIRQDTTALPLIAQRLSDPDSWVRAKAGAALRSYTAVAASAQLTPMLTAFTANATDPDVIDWNDPVQISNRYLSLALFGNAVGDGTPGNNVAAYTVNAAKSLLYPAVRAGLKQPDSYPRAGAAKFCFDRLPLADVQALILDFFDVIEIECLADRMWGAAPRESGIKTLSKYKITQGIPLALAMLEIPAGFEWGSTDVVTGGLNALAAYGDASRWTLPTLRGYLGTWSAGSTQYTTLVSTIASIENAITAPTEAPGLAVANSQVVATTGAKAITLSGASPRSALTFTNVNAPAHGTLNGIPPNLIYTPTGGYTGPDSFTFQVIDSLTTSVPGTVSIIVGTAGSGLKGEYHDNADFTNLKLTRTDAAVDFDWAAGSPNALIGTDTFSVRWSGLLLVPETGTYTFSSLNSDGVRLYVNGVPVIDDFADQATHWNDGTSVNLTAGQMVELQMDYFENTGSAVAKLKWAGPSFAGNNGAIIGTQWLFDGTGLPRTPYAHPQGVTLAQNIAQAITLTGSGGTLTYSVVTQPTHGTLTGTAPNLTYTPTASYNGSDSFTFRVNNGTSNSAPATVSIGISAGTPVNYTWLNAASGNLSVAGNWTAGAAPAATGQPTYNLNFTPAGTYTVTHNLNSGFQLNQLNVAGAVTLAGTNSLAFTANGFLLPQFNQDSVNAMTLSAPVSLAAMTRFGGNGNGLVTISSLISGTGGLTKASAGTLQINNVNNTYSGGTIIDTGIVALGLQANAALGTGPVTLNQGGTLTLDRINATNPLTLNGGTINSYNGWGNSFNNSVTLSAATTVNCEYNMTLSGTISGAGGFTKTGANSLILSGTNSFTGANRINVGTLSCSNAAALGTGTLSISSGAKVALNFTGSRTIAALTLGGTPMPAGSYGSTASPATNKNDTYFSGTGTVSAGQANRAPVASPQSVSTAEDTQKQVTLSATDADGNPLTFVIVTQPAHGSLSGTAPNVTYTPALHYYGADSFAFKANDGTLDSAAATISITVTAVNDAPMATAQSVTTVEDTAKAITLAGADVEGSALTYSIVAQPAQGSLSGTAPNLTYMPTANSNGADSFTFRANDGTANSASATVSITVTAVNDAPVATAQSVTSPLNTAKTITLTGTDAEGGGLTYGIVTSPAHGTLSGTSPNVTFTPTTGYIGADSFTFKANDGTLDSAPATVNITVSPTSFTWNSAVSGNWSDGTKWTSGSPASAGLAVYVFNFNAVGTYTATHDLNAGFLLNQIHFGGSTVTLGGNSLALVANGASLPRINQNSATPAIINAPMSLASNATFGGSGAGSVTLSDLVSGTGGLTKDSAGLLDIYGLTANTYSGGTTINSGTLHLGTMVGGISPLCANPAGTGTVTLNSGTIELARVTAANALTMNGGTLLSNNGWGATWSGPITLNATPTLNATWNLTCSGTISGTGGFSKTGGKTLILSGTNTYTGASTITAGTLSCTNSAALGSGALSITSGAKLDLSFTGTRQIASLTIAGTPMPDGTYGSTSSAATYRNDSYFSGAGTVTVVNDGPAGYLWCAAEGGTYVFTGVVDVAYGANGTFNFMYGVTGSITFNNGAFGDPVPGVPKAGYYAAGSFNYLPVANAQNVTAAEDLGQPIALTATDADGDSLTYTILSPPAHGTLGGTAPNVTYTPTTHYNGADSFTFKVNDGTIDSAIATISVTVTAVNDAPVATAQSVSTAEDIVKAITLAGTDVEGSVLTYAIVTPPASGTLSGTAPNLTYMPTANSNGPDSFTFRVNDGTANSAIATVSITVVAVNDPPLIYEPFNYAAGGLNGMGGTTDVGLTGTWNANASTLVVAGSLNYGTLPVGGGSIGNLTYFSNRFGGSRAVNSTALVGNGLLADGATLWFSLEMGYGRDAGGTPANLANARLGFALANSSFNTANFKYWINDEGAQKGSGLGVTLGNLGGTGRTVATQFRDLTAGDGTAGNVTGTFTGAAIGLDQSRLVVGKITWGAASDTIEIYQPDTNLNLGPVVSTLSVAVNQSTYDTISFQRGDPVTMDEIRFGASYESVITAVGLPLPWLTTDIGTGMVAGSATYHASTYSLDGSGIIGSTSDKLRFTYQTLSGDGAIIAKISTMEDTGSSSRVGVMIRDSLATNSGHVFMGMSGANAYQWAYRTTGGETTTTTPSSTGVIPSTWIKIVRTGNSLVSSKSTDGITWTTVGTISATFAPNCYIGLAVGSGSDATLNTSQFSNLSVTP